MRVGRDELSDPWAPGNRCSGAVDIHPGFLSRWTGWTSKEIFEGMLKNPTELRDYGCRGFSPMWYRNKVGIWNSYIGGADPRGPKPVMKPLKTC